MIWRTLVADMEFGDVVEAECGVCGKPYKWTFHQVESGEIVPPGTIDNEMMGLLDSGEYPHWLSFPEPREICGFLVRTDG